ncbi:hypothetical protein M011DRAFT_463266 [Sporormia fimetaria CBS 119925]|uniref:Membrane-associated proteins in eicosanoid and glutathione metabolism n=1 Tax=Sporormia fimetaria CBS 119925 TaxID=1340428 RepID=A0A6A6VMD3_9PLEO|nr:hypothetical protein M011DRAFT_463266 [Sporormia fimetaria CBS 119925]
MTTNYSFYAVPAYWFLALLPHGIAASTIQKANNNQWDNVNPRSAGVIEDYKKKVPAAAFAKYERAEAAHKNMMENGVWFLGAVILGNMAGLSNSYMNAVTAAYLALRVAYIFLYIGVTKPKLSYARSVSWGVSWLLLMTVYVQAGSKVAKFHK